MSTEAEMRHIYAKNKGPLMVMADITVINRAPLTDLKRLVTEAQQGKVFVNEILDYIGPQGYRRPDFVSPFGLEWTRTQGSKGWETLAGCNHHEAIVLSRRIHAQQEVIKAFAGAPDTHIWKRGTMGNLEPLQYPLSLAGEFADPISDYTSAWHSYLDYFERLMGPQDVIDYCTEKIVQNRAYLLGGMNIRINMPLKPDEITVVESLLAGYDEAITRNEKRLRHPGFSSAPGSTSGIETDHSRTWFGLWTQGFAFAHTS